MGSSLGCQSRARTRLWLRSRCQLFRGCTWNAKRKRLAGLLLGYAEVLTSIKKPVSLEDASSLSSPQKITQVGILPTILNASGEDICIKSVSVNAAELMCRNSSTSLVSKLL